MRISIICFSLTGYMTAEDLQKDLQGKGYTAEIYKKSKYLDDSIVESTGIWAGRHFETDDGSFLSEPVESRCAALHLT